MPSLIEIKGVHKIYSRGTSREKAALNGLSIDIKEGEVFALLGANGAGKSTLSSILAGLHPPTEGDVKFLGESIYRDLPRFRLSVGYCPQKPNLDKQLTLYENLLYSGLCYGHVKQEVERNLEALLEAFRLNEYRDFKAYALSGGYRQRFLIARSLVHQPKFVILDEPTVGLDPHVRRELWGHIHELKSRGVTVLLTTHYLDEAEELADRVCLIDRGQLKLVDTPSNLKSGFKKSSLEQVFIEMVKQAEKGEE